MSALSTPSGGGTQSKPTAGKQKYQKLDINSLYCTNRNENSEPSSVKSQLSRKHGMQSLGKVPSTRRPPANLPSLKTETGQDSNTNSVSTTSASVSSPPTCTSQTLVTSASSAGAGAGWVPLPPPASPHFRNEFPSLEAAAQPHHRPDHHTQLRPQTEGSWTSGGTAGARPESSGSPAPAPTATAQTPAYRAILPSFLVKGNGGGGGGLGLGALGALRETRPPPRTQRAPAAPRAVEVLTARPILRDDQISSLDDMSRDAGWAQHDDIDYDQKLDFSDGESSAPSKGGRNNRASIENERDSKHDLDEDQLWVERRQKQNNEVAQAVARARQRKEEEQRRQRDATTQDFRDKSDPDSREKDRLDTRDRQDVRERQDTRDRQDVRDRIDRQDVRDMRDRQDVRDNRDRQDVRDNRDRQDVRDSRDRQDVRDTRDRQDARDNRDRQDVRDTRDRQDVRDNRDRQDVRDNRDRPDVRDSRDRPDVRDTRDRQDVRDSRDRPDTRDSRDRQDVRDKERSDRDKQEPRDRARSDNRERQEDKDRIDTRDRSDRDRFERERDRNDRERDRDRGDRDRADRPDRDRADRPDRDRADRPDRDRADRDRPDRDRSDRDREFRDRDARDRDYARDQSNPAFSKSFQQNIPPRFLKQQQQQGRQEEPHKGWAFSGKPAPRRPDPAYTAPRHPPQNGRRSYSRDYSDREDDFRRDKDGSGPQWRSEMQDYERSGRELDRSNSKDSYKDFNDYKAKNDSDRKLLETGSDQSGRSAAEKLSEVFERKSICIIEPFASTEPAAAERRATPPARRPSTEKDCTKSTSWAEVAQEESNNVLKSSVDNTTSNTDQKPSNQNVDESKRNTTISPTVNPASTSTSSQNKINTHASSTQSTINNNQQTSQATNLQPQPIVPQIQTTSMDNHNQTKFVNQSVSGPTETFASLLQKAPSSDQLPQSFAKALNPQKSEKESTESVQSGPKTAGDATSSKTFETAAGAVLHPESAKRTDDKRADAGAEHTNRVPSKESIERKSSGSGSEKKGRGFGGYAVYNRGRGPREARGRRHRSARSKNRASESDGSAEGAPPAERRDRRRAPRSPRAGKKPDRAEDVTVDAPPPADGLENREPFAPRGQPSRRGRGGFQGACRPPAPAKRLAGYGPPNTRSPFGQANRAHKDGEDAGRPDDRPHPADKPRAPSSAGRGRDRRPKATAGPPSGEDENWETTSEHSEGGGRRRSAHPAAQPSTHRGQGGRSSRNSNAARGNNAHKKDNCNENKTADTTEAATDSKSTGAKRDDEVADDGFQEVRNKKNSKDARGPSKDDAQAPKRQPRSHSNQGGGRNGSSSRNSGDKGGGRAAQAAGKGAQYERPRQANLAPRFVKQRQKQQLGLGAGYAADSGAAPPPPAVNAWDKPLRAAADDPAEERSSPRAAPAPPEPAPSADAPGVLDGTTPPVETIIFENTNYKSAPAEDAPPQQFQPATATAEDLAAGEAEPRAIPFNGDARARPRSIRDLMGEGEGEAALALRMSFDGAQKAEDSSDMKLDFAFDSELGQLTEEKAGKSAGLARAHLAASTTISPLAADLNLKIASVKKVWEMPAVAEGGEELQFGAFEEGGGEAGAPPNVCKVKPTQQLQSPPPQLYNHAGYAAGYGGLSVPSPPAVLFNSSQQQGLYGAFLDQSRGQFGGFPPAPYGAGSAAPYNYQPPPDMFQTLPSQYRMAATPGAGAAFPQSGQLANSPSTVLISSTSNSLMSATVKPSSQQIGAIGSKGGGVSAYQQQYLGYSGPVGEYSLQGLVPRGAPPASSYYAPYQAGGAPQQYPLQFPQAAQSSPFGSQYLSSAQLQVAAAVQQMQQQYRAPPQQQFAPRPPHPLKSPLHEHANGFAPLCEAASPTPKPAKPPQKAPHSPPHHKYHAPPPHHQVPRARAPPPRYPAPIQRPLAPTPPAPRAPRHPSRAPPYYPHQPRNGERAPVGEAAADGEAAPPGDAPPAPRAAE